MTERIAFKLENGTPGTALILIADLADGRKLVACANEDEENDAPVNMVVEKLFASVCQRHGFDKNKVVWVEYTGYEVPFAFTTVGGWELITWRAEPGRSPKWDQMTAEHWAALGTVPPTDPNTFVLDR